MAHAKITLIGMYNFLNSANDDLFKNLSVPNGIDKNTLINTILLNGGEYEVLYPDAIFFQNAIGVWSDKWQRTMQRWITALSIDYNPLENYDRMEDWFDNSSKQSKDSGMNNAVNIRSDATNKNEIAIASDISESEGDGTTTNTRSAYDSGTYQPHDESTTGTTGSNTSNGVTNAVGDIKTDNTEILNGSNTTEGNEIHMGLHSGRLHGNIGVTTSQQMLEAELDVSKFNIYNEISDLFVSELLIYVDD